MRRTSSFASRTLTAAVALGAAVVLAGCASLSSAISSAAASSSASGTAQASGAATERSTGGGLAKIHDPGQVTFSLTLTSCTFRDGGQLPDPKCTPGAI